MKSLVRIPTLLWFFFTLIVYLSVLISPLSFKYAGVISFGIPILILLNFGLLVLSAIFKWKVGWVALFLLLCGWPFINVAISINGDDNLEQEGFKILNYNVKWFTDARSNNYQAVLDWINEQNVDVLCFQEFYPNRQIAERIIESGAYYLSMDNERFSNAIFSKHPIVNEGLLFEDDRLNNIRFADIKAGHDTIRVYSVHLKSMGIDPNKIQTTDDIKDQYQDVTSKFLFSSANRANQLNDLLDHTKECKYPILMVGDFNDVPFSNNYFRLRRYFYNAFEKEGRGLGVTYNNKIPYLRIDNQFYSAEFDLKAFKTMNDVPYSDHFPLIGIYGLSN